MKTNSKAEAQFHQEYSEGPTFGSRFDTADFTDRARVNHKTLSAPLVFTPPASNFVAIPRPDWLDGTTRQVFPPKRTVGSGVWVLEVPGPKGIRVG
jgi:hypothetical protein